MFFLAFFVFLDNHIFSQRQLSESEADKFSLYQDSLKSLTKDMFRSRSDAVKLLANEKFLSLMQTTLETERSFYFDFDSLVDIGRLRSPDNTFRIINWNLPMEDGTHQYYGFIQSYSKKTRKQELFKLIDMSDEIPNPENYVSDNKKWYGMLYYKIISVKYKNITYYTLLGWDGNNNLSQKKFIEPISFSSGGTPKFGGADFEIEKKNPKRIVYEYSANIVMSLKYDEQAQLIVADHLSPINQGLEGQYQFYGPDFTYDAYRFKKGKWIHEKNYDARNEKSKLDNMYNDPKKKQEVKQKDFYIPQR